MRRVELIQRNLQQGIVGHRTPRERVDDHLEILERLGTACSA
jgi:hypothetical protein